MRASFLLLLFLSFASLAQNDDQLSDIYIYHVNIIDVESGSIDTNRNVKISNGKIKSVSETARPFSSLDVLIDGEGKYLMPGLTEMHAHIPPPTTSEQRIKEVLFLYCSNGITTIRGMLGDSSHLHLRTLADKRSILSPRIYTSSPSLNGNSITSMEEADRKVRKYKKDGYDFLKIHPGIKREVFDQVVATANEVEIPFAGHVPVEVGIRHALRSKYASIDHVDGFLEGLVPESAGKEADENGFFGYAFTPYADESLIEELVNLSRENEVWIVPTQSLFERWFAPVSAEELLSQPEMKYMPPATRRNWLRVKNQYMEDENFSIEQWKDFDALRKKLIKSLSTDGHGILMGSDAPQLFNVPGFSIHHEIDGMQKAGLSNIEIIQSGTINPALFFGEEDQWGSVGEGMIANLILLNSNPLEDLDALQDLQGVVLNGQWLSKENIDLKLKEIEGRLQDE